MKTEVCSITVGADIPETLRVAVVSDVHSQPPTDALDIVKASACSFIAVTGDLIHNKYEIDDGLSFLKELALIAPTIFSVGNHEKLFRRELKPQIEDSGAVFLDNSYIRFMGIYIGALTPGSGEHRTFKKTPPAGDTRWLDEFEALRGFKLLLCHHPEYYCPYIKGRSIDLTLSGHAHGGQWRIFNRGVYAPGQGFFPKYTSGLYENRLIVSRGLANRAPVPRIANPPQIIVLTLSANI